MPTESIVLLLTFGVLSVLHAVKKHYHFLYLRETDMRLRSTVKPSDLKMVHKRDLESFERSRLLSEVTSVLLMPLFQPASTSESETAKRLARKIRIVLGWFYIVLVLFAGQILTVTNVI